MEGFSQQLKNESSLCRQAMWLSLNEPFKHFIPPVPHTHTHADFFSERFSHLLRVTQQVYVRCILNFYSQTCTLDFSIILRTSDHLEEPKCRWNDYLLPFHGCTVRLAKSQFLDQGLNLSHWSECTES